MRLLFNQQKLFYYKEGVNMTPNGEAKQYNTTVKEMALAWKCSQQNIRELHKNAHHKFIIIAIGSRNTKPV